LNDLKWLLYLRARCTSLKITIVSRYVVQDTKGLCFNPMLKNVGSWEPSAFVLLPYKYTFVMQYVVIVTIILGLAE